jgi:hypothetical protein
MRPRTILDVINGNRGVNNELTPNQRGKIEGVITFGASFTQAAKVVNCDPETARKTILFAPKRQNRQSRSRPGRPPEWDARFEKRLVRIVRIHLRTTYAELRDQLYIYLFHDTLVYILKKYHNSKWLSKQRLFLSFTVVKRRLYWALRHADWTWED